MKTSTVCSCKICRNNLADIVNQKNMDGISILEVKKYLQKNHNLDVTENVIKRHLKAYGIDINIDKSSDDISIKSEIIMNATDSVINKDGIVLFDLNNVDLDKYDFDLENPETFVNYIQKIHIGLYLKQLEITYKELNEYQNGHRENYPNNAINNLKKLYELLEKTSGINNFVSVNSAIRKITNEGYMILDSDDKPNEESFKDPI